jgi:hypothetical protein
MENAVQLPVLMAGSSRDGKKGADAGNAACVRRSMSSRWHCGLAAWLDGINKFLPTVSPIFTKIVLFLFFFAGLPAYWRAL